MKKKLYNITMGVLGNVIILLFGFIVPRVVLVYYGSDTNGLLNSMTQIFTYAALLEAGISRAAVNALYKPIQEMNKDGVSIVMSVARRYYRRVTVIYTLVVLCFSAIAPFVIKTSIDHVTVFLVFLLEGMSNVVAFYFINVWKCLLNADGCSYIINAINLVGKLLGYLTKIVLAVLGVRIVYIQLGYFLISLAKLFFYSQYMKKHYGWIDYGRSSNDTKLKDRNSFVIIEIAWTIFSSTDMIILSIMVSTAASSVYSVYNLVFLAFSNLMNGVFNSLYYNLGQLYHENRERYIQKHDLYNSIFIGLTTMIMSVTYFMLLPFIKLYTSGVNDTNYMYKFLPLLFCLVHILSWDRYVSGYLASVAGYAKQLSKISLIEALTNVVCSLLLVNRYGIYGVLFATVVALPLKVIYCTYLSDKVILKRSVKKTISIIIVNYVVFLIAVCSKRWVNIRCDTVLEFCINGCILLLLFAVVTFVFNGLVNKDVFYLPNKLCKMKGIRKTQ